MKGSAVRVRASASQKPRSAGFLFAPAARSHDVAAGASEGAVDAAESVRDTWRALEEFNLNPSLALEALFVRLRRALRTARGARAARA